MDGRCQTDSDKKTRSSTRQQERAEEFVRNPAQRVVENLGNGTVGYVGIQAADPPQLTAWTISMYGRLVLSDDRRAAKREAVSCTTGWVITGLRELAESFTRLRRHDGVS